jgi:hypothetical protein
MSVAPATVDSACLRRARAAVAAGFGSGRVASCGLVLLGVTVWTVSVAPNWLGLAAALLVVGALDAIVDVAQNAHGLRVQRLYQRSILNAFHGVWSIGAVAGGLLGSAAAGLRVPLVAHLGASAVAFGVLALVASRGMLARRDEPEPAAEEVLRERPRRRAAVPALAVLGVLAACGAFVEDAGASWSALYLRTELDAGAATAGWHVPAVRSPRRGWASPSRCRRCPPRWSASPWPVLASPP